MSRGVHRGHAERAGATLSEVIEFRVGASIGVLLRSRASLSCAPRRLGWPIAGT